MNAGTLHAGFETRKQRACFKEPVSNLMSPLSLSSAQFSPSTFVITGHRTHKIAALRHVAVFLFLSFILNFPSCHSTTQSRSSHEKTFELHADVTKMLARSADSPDYITFTLFSLGPGRQKFLHLMFTNRSKRVCFKNSRS